MSDSHSTPEHANASNEREDLSAEDLQKVSGARKLFETLELFAGLNPAEIQEIAASANTLHVEADQTLFRQSEEATAMYVVESGELEVRATTPMGEDVILAVLTAGSIVGEMALLEGAPRSATVRSLGSATLYQLSRQSFAQLRTDKSVAAYKLIVNLARNLGDRRRQTDKRVAEVFDDPTQHIDAFENQAHGLLAKIRKA